MALKNVFFATWYLPVRPLYRMYRKLSLTFLWEGDLRLKLEAYWSNGGVMTRGKVDSDALEEQGRLWIAIRRLIMCLLEHVVWVHVRRMAVRLYRK